MIEQKTCDCGRPILPCYDRCVIHELKKLDNRPFRPKSVTSGGEKAAG